METSKLYGVYGSMGGGKSTLLVKEAYKLAKGNWEWQAFFPRNSRRKGQPKNRIVSRMGGSIEAIMFDEQRPEEILEHVQNYCLHTDIQ